MKKRILFIDNVRRYYVTKDQVVLIWLQALKKLILLTVSNPAFYFTIRLKGRVFINRK